MATKHEERRRRIAERGSDRLALITGRIQTLPSSPPPSPVSLPSLTPRPLRTHVLSPSLFSLDRDQPPLSPLPDVCHDTPEATTVSHDHEINSHEFSRQKDIIDNTEYHEAEHDRFPKKDNKTEATFPSEEITKTQSSSTLIEDQKPLINPSLKVPLSKPLTTQKPNLFTCKRLNSCIISSQNKRVCCSLIIAFLVVLSSTDYPLFGRRAMNSRSVITSRPLYILILTDATIVMGQMMLERRNDHETGGDDHEEREDKERQRQVDGQDQDAHNWTAAVKVLERGLVVYQAFRGIFIDCSIYAVIVICGLSLV